MSAPLAELQRWFLQEIVQPHEQAPDAALASHVGGDRPAVAAMVLPSPTMTPAQRMRVYQYGYFARLYGCLVEDFPAVKAIVGEDAFRQLCREYLDAFPARSYTLTVLGDHFTEFLDGKAAATTPAAAAGGAVSAYAPNWTLLTDVARLDLAIMQVFHAPRSPKLSAERLQEIATEQWPTARFVAAHALQVHAFWYRANEIATAVRQKKPLPDLGRAASWTAVVRREDYQVWRTPLTEVGYELLRRLVEGASVGDALETVAQAHPDDESLQTQVFAWFRSWVRLGVFADVVVVD